MDKPAVSILLPYRNTVSTLAECIESILCQSFTNFELLAINEHSRDESEQLVRYYQQQDSRVRMLHNNSKGLVAALNYGVVTAATTPLIARMDADDIMRTNRLLRQTEALQTHNDWSLVASQADLFPASIIRKGFREYMRWQNKCLTPDDIAADIFIESPFVHPTVMFRKAAVIQLGGYRQGMFPEDYELWLRMPHAGLVMGKVEEVLLDWRESGQRLTRTDLRCSDDAFSRLRADYLAKDPRLLNGRPLVIWGAGRKTRRRCQHLLDKGFSIDAWIDIDPRKIGNYIKGVPVLAPASLPSQEPRPFILCYVRNHGARDMVRNFLENLHYQRASDFLFVG